MKHLRGYSLILLLIAFSLLLTNCEQKSSTGPSPSGLPPGLIGNVALTATNLELYSVPGVAVTTQITATVTDTVGQAVPGVLVRFSTPSIGSISTTQDSTDNDGKVIVTFNSQGQFGLANITATVTSGSETKTGTITIGVYPLTGVADKITISLSPKILYLDDGADDSLKVTIRVMDSMNVGIPGLQVSLRTTLGVISIVDTSDMSGTAVTYVHTNEEFGMGLVTASVNTSMPDTGSGLLGAPGGGDVIPNVSNRSLQQVISEEAGFTLSSGSGKGNRQTDEIFVISDVDTFWVFPIDQQIGGLSVGSWPTTLSVAPDTIGIAMITATIVDPNNIGIQGVPVSFATSKGILASSAGLTDSTGRVTTTYYSQANYYGLVNIWAVVGAFSDTCTIVITPTISGNGTLLLYNDTNLIYADNGITSSNLTALLKDADNQVIANALIIFTSDYGTVNSPVLTDSTGQARATFRDIGFASFPDSAMVIAKFPTLNLADTVHIMIAEARGIDHIVLNVASNIMTANGTDSTRADATVYLENNDLAPQGTDVNFIVSGSNLGRFSAPIATVGLAGTATVYYYSGIATGVDTLRAMVDGVFSNPMPVTLQSGPPSNIDIAVNPPSLPVNSLEMAIVTATVRDTTMNLVGNNIGVYFSTTLGSLSPLEAPTVNGVATTYLSPSTNAGTGWVKAQIGAIFDSTLITFIPSTPSQIGLSTQLTTIQVQGTGGNYQTEIRAHVRDAAGNYVGNNVMVHFKIQNNGFPGGGVNINNHGMEDSTQTNGGVAAVVLNAGTNSGPVTIKAWTYNNEGVEIWAQSPLVTIVAGPPDYLNIGVPYGNIRDGGGDIWQTEVSAIVFDRYGNEVVDSTVVHFYILPYDIAEVAGDGYTHNVNWAGNSYEGIAFTMLSYHSYSTFDSVRIYAYCVVDGDSIINYYDYQLPLSEGELELSVVPVAWNYDYPPPGYSGNPARMKCITQLKDGHEIPIDNAEIVFYSTRGAFYYREFPEQLPPPQTQYFGYYATTGPDTSSVWEENNAAGSGACWMYLLTQYSQAFPDPNQVETTGQIYCEVVGYYNISSDPITVTYTQSP